MKPTDFSLPFGSEDKIMGMSALEPCPVNPPEADLEVDARGLNCPLPILKAKKGLSTLTSGQIIKVLATDPNSERDFQDFARQTGNTLIGQSTQGTEITHWLRRR
jgi:tRNA 2-thiouridine synthesizing protein A